MCLGASHDFAFRLSLGFCTVLTSRGLIPASFKMLVRCNQNEFRRSVCRFPDQFGLKRPDSVEEKSVFENLHEIGQSRVSGKNSISGNRCKKTSTMNQIDRKVCIKTGRQTTSTDEEIIDFGLWEP